MSVFTGSRFVASTVGGLYLLSSYKLIVVYFRTERYDGAFHLYKSRKFENKFSIGQSWPLEQLRAIEGINVSLNWFSQV